MAWNLTGEFVETCSCNMFCPCWYGKAELMIMDQGWCATSILVRVKAGQYDGVDLAGQNAVVNLHFPGPTLFDADGTGRVHIDDGASDAQAAALEHILQGKSGGGMEVPASLVSTWLPSRRSAISVAEADGKLEAKVDGVGSVVSQRLVNDAGGKMTMQGAAFSMAFGFNDHLADLAPSDGTAWNDPDMPVVWQGRSGAVGQVSWASA